MNKIFVTSDIWFNRPTGKMSECSINEYNDMIIKNWNKTVGKKDVVYILGGIGISELYHLVVKLNGEIHILNNYFTKDEIEFVDNLYNSIDSSSDKKLKQKIIFHNCQIMAIPQLDVFLSYLPLSEWCGMETGTFCFHGLNSFSDFENNNISCKSDNYEYKPISIEDICNNINKFRSKL